MKKYNKPKIEEEIIEISDVIALSGETSTNKTNGNIWAGDKEVNLFD